MCGGVAVRDLGSEDLNRGAHRGKRVENGCSRRIQSHIVYQHVRIAEQGGRGDEEDGGRQIAGNVERLGAQLATAICTAEAVDSNRAAIFFDGRAKFFDGQFGMVPSTLGLRDTGPSLREQASEKNS